MNTTPPHDVTGLHHVTCIAGDPQRNLDFYTGTVGMRLVKRSVNQDAPDTYHLFYADAEGHTGTDLTFFPWPDAVAPQLGHGLAVEVSLEVPEGSLDYWSDRLARYGFDEQRPQQRFGDRLLQVVDPHGLHLALVEPGIIPARRFTPWDHSSVPAERQIRGLYGAQLWEREAASTRGFLLDVLGFETIAGDGEWTRYGVA